MRLVKLSRLEHRDFFPPIEIRLKFMTLNETSEVFSRASGKMIIMALFFFFAINFRF